MKINIYRIYNKCSLDFNRELEMRAKHVGFVLVAGYALLILCTSVILRPVKAVPGRIVGQNAAVAHQAT